MNQNENFKLDDHFKFSLSSDIAAGMKYLHRRNIVHGSLSSTSCFIDSRWNVKIADWEYTHMAGMLKTRDIAQVAAIDTSTADLKVDIRNQYAAAPELLMRTQFRPTKPCDVYSYRSDIFFLFLPVLPCEVGVVLPLLPLQKRQQHDTTPTCSCKLCATLSSALAAHSWLLKTAFSRSPFTLSSRLMSSGLPHFRLPPCSTCLALFGSHRPFFVCALHTLFPTMFIFDIVDTVRQKSDLTYCCDMQIRPIIVSGMLE